MVAGLLLKAPAKGKRFVFDEMDCEIAESRCYSILSKAAAQSLPSLQVEMRSMKLLKKSLSCLILFIAPVASTLVHAHGNAHVHGLIRLNVAIDAKNLTVQIEAPLDSLLGFEHRPRTAAQHQAVETMLKQMNNVSALIQPAKAAACHSTTVSVEAPVLQSSQPTASKEADHADLSARFDFVCEHPDKLAAIELGFFDAFKRVQKIDVQVAGPKGQSKQTLKRPSKTLKLP